MQNPPRAGLAPGATAAPGVSIGQASDRGRKPANQDCHGALVPAEPLRTLKGIALALADGISSSPVSHIASETAVKSFLEDYYCTSEAWTVQTAASRVVAATNSWLYAQTRRGPHRYERDRGYVCTFSALVLRGHSAHLLHVGDSRIYRLRDGALEQLTHDHRQWVAADESYLSRALGMQDKVAVDYSSLPLRPGDVFLLATDGVYEFLQPQQILDALQSPTEDLDSVAGTLLQSAFDAGSADNLTLQIARIDHLPQRAADNLQARAEALPLPPPLQAGQHFDGYHILRALHHSARSHTWLAEDASSGQQVVIKTPATEQSDNPAYLERFLLEEWIARRISSPHVLQAAPVDRERQFLYTTTVYLDGQTLAQWLRDNPRPSLETVRGIIEQVARGLLAFHRREMLHRDLRPENVVIDCHGTVKLIDFGAVYVAGLAELGREEDLQIPGTALYCAPEYFLGQTGSARSDLYSLGILTYYLLSGDFPYGPGVARARSLQAQRRLRYRSLATDDNDVPAWVDAALRRAVQMDPMKRQGELSEFLYELRHPGADFLARDKPPLLERNPVAFWQGVAVVQLLLILALLHHLL
ncbi:bifunctional protein-serine/threonine kinase/phosphatase [Parahaliea aestuarii]|uniref:Bifunctional protein-serine/threonine kinase/phosphatase n=1 Tax=Parahaliea aestuarii TaxID=1852021 RepID=A0A5C9A1Q5_9GAMM|nr:bifunctional protein-serine/threonine kinase/phosphatase [Parahaliea aestuarii]TXS94698.1 bifunctional protein-serine/threonine kinase/phosphatase [Parahaliea aestuarii]